MTIQWIEKVDAVLPHGRWLEAHAGFGYGDPKNLSHVKMQDEVRSLYIRKPFEVENLDGGMTVRLAGTWKSVALSSFRHDPGIRSSGTNLRHKFPCIEDHLST